MKAEHVKDDLSGVLFTKEQIAEKVRDLAQQIDRDYEGRDVLLVGVLKGAVPIMADLMRELDGQYPMDWMAVSSYGSGTKSSGVVRILKDLDKEIEGRDVLIVEDIIDSGLTLSWLMRNLKNRNPRSLNVITLLRKPERLTANIDMFDIGFDIPNEFVVGYGLDYAERYRDLQYVGTLHPRVYSGAE